MEAERVLAERWQELLGWVDGWFDPGAVDRHDFDRNEREAFLTLAAGWRAGSDRIELLDRTAERYGRDVVVSVVRRLCADETAAYWTGLAAREGRTLDDLMRLLWEPLRAEGFDFSAEARPDGIQIHCAHCPQADFGAALELAGHPTARGWLYEIVCSTDFHVTQAFEQPLRFERTKTLMQGDDHCDHRYVVSAS